MKTMHLGFIRQECKYANRYSTHGKNANVEEERMHVPLFRGRSVDGGCGVARLSKRKNKFKREQEGEKQLREYEGMQGTAQRHTV